MGFAPFAFYSLYNGILEYSSILPASLSSSFMVTGLLVPEKCPTQMLRKGRFQKQLPQLSSPRKSSPSPSQLPPAAARVIPRREREVRTCRGHRCGSTNCPPGSGCLKKNQCPCCDLQASAATSLASIPRQCPPPPSRSRCLQAGSCLGLLLLPPARLLTGFPGEPQGILPTSMSPLAV